MKSKRDFVTDMNPSINPVNRVHPDPILIKGEDLKVVGVKDRDAQDFQDGVNDCKRGRPGRMNASRSYNQGYGHQKHLEECESASQYN